MSYQPCKDKERIYGEELVAVAPWPGYSLTAYIISISCKLGKKKLTFNQKHLTYIVSLHCINSFNFTSKTGQLNTQYGTSTDLNLVYLQFQNAISMSKKIILH